MTSRSSRDDYQSPLASRYATAQMLENFSDTRRILVWRDLWIALAKAQSGLELPVSDAQVAALVEHRETIDFEKVAVLEAKFRHDVMAHVHHYGQLAGEDAARIIHLGATSCYVTDNAELVIMRDGLELLMDRLYTAVAQLREFAIEQAAQPCLAYTHYQPAQLTTVGKRACLWAQDLAMDLETLDAVRKRLPFRGVKGTTGTQASFLALLDGDHEKVRALDKAVCESFGFSESIPVSGQTYTRKVDSWITAALADVAGSAAKMASDIRLLAHEREVEEPFGKKQIGSSAMAYKRNPMRSERICSLARFVHSLVTSARETHANQWLERTLDDSANRRLVLTESFLAVDAILNLVVDVTSGLVVNPAVIARNMSDELPFMATENVIMRATKAGGDRQQLHERVRELSMAAGRRMKEEGASNDLVSRMQADPDLGPHVADDMLAPELYIGRAEEQVHEFVESTLRPLMEQHGQRKGRFEPRVRV